MNKRKEVNNRLKVVFAIFIVSMLLVFGQIFTIQVLQKEKWKDKLSDYEKTEYEVKADRGDILDCKGRLLGGSIPSYEIYMDMRAGGLNNTLFYNNLDSLAYCLSHTIRDKSHAQYKSDLTKAYRAGKRYYRVTRHRLTYNQFKEVKEFPLFRLGKNKSGFIANKIDQRKRPFGVLAARTIGTYNAKENRGSVGIENAFNAELTGIPGTEIRKKIGNQWIAIRQLEPINGKSIKTTIDIDIQDIAETALLNQMEAYQPKFGTAIVMEVKTGQIKAIANLGRSSNGNYYEKYNYAIGESMEPGSTFKLASMMVALEDGCIDLNDTIDTGNGKYKFYDRVLSDSHDDGYGRITAREVFEHSSNIGVAKIINDNYKSQPERYIDRLYAMSLNESLNISIKGEREPFIKYPGSETWSGISLPWISIGYEVSLTPLHTLTFYNAVANDGKMVRPSFVTDILENGKSIESFGTEVINSSICSKSTIKKAQALLEGVVENGTAKNLNKTHLKIAGKTGTARVANANKGYGNLGFKYRASFCGYFPAEEPLYSCIVLVESPSRKGIYGNVVAGTVFREIADKIYAQLYDLNIDNDQVAEKTEYKVPITMDGHYEELKTILSEIEATQEIEGPCEEWVRTYNQNDHIVIKGQRQHENIMPNVRGMGAKDAIFILENCGLRVNLKGSGRVSYQSIPNGQRIIKGQSINIELQ